VLIDQLPDAMSYVTDSLGTGVRTGNTITWTLGNLAANTSSSIVLTATAVIAGAQADMAVISGDLIDANPLSNSSVFTTTVSGVDPSSEERPGADVWRRWVSLHDYLRQSR
jgi:hypothetical protein